MLVEQEHSPRCFHLTTLILKLKMNNYYALMLRRDCLFSNEVFPTMGHLQLVA
jgi:hypothetical protein